ncbi:alpha/beta hydrolase fold domain-containing protein [Paraburkholderia caribensis]|uniref:alpha/beta hydrolase fold domain-containing protein n=1 Tax=Paraburkholderia caribensis TaxID=75105 RepID=UPI0034D22F6F
MTRITNKPEIAEVEVVCPKLAAGYRAYLPTIQSRLHPYAAPIESCRLKGLPPALVATPQHDLLKAEAEHYASALVASGVALEFAQFPNTS